MRDDATARHPRGPAQGARGQRAHEAVNVLVPAVVVVAASLLGASLLVAVALFCWLGLAFVTFFDEDEAARVGHRRRAARARPVRPPLPSPSRARPSSRNGSGARTPRRTRSRRRCGNRSSLWTT